MSGSDEIDDDTILAFMRVARNSDEAAIAWAALYSASPRRREVCRKEVAARIKAIGGAA